MSWVRIDDNFPSHPKVKGLTHVAYRLHTVAMCYCARNLTDGALDKGDVAVVAAEARCAQPRRSITELVEAELWVAVGGGGYLINDYLEYNPSAEKVKEEREKARDRMKRIRSREHSAERAPVRSGVRSGTPSRPLKEPDLLDFEPELARLRARNEAAA